MFGKGGLGVPHTIFSLNGINYRQEKYEDALKASDGMLDSCHNLDKRKIEKG